MQEEYREIFSLTPVKALKPSTRRELTLFLDELRIASTNNGILRDWRGLAELAEFTNDHVIKFRNCSSPTETLLEIWQKNSDNTLGKLVYFLEEMGRFDIIDDLMQLFIRDANHYTSTYETSSYQIQDAEVSSGSTVSSSLFNEEEAIVVSDTYGTRECFDAYICNAKADEAFVKELEDNLEGLYNLKLCIPDRDFLAGIVERTATINMIRKRCRRMIIVLSPAFLDSPEHSFLTMLAQSISVDDRVRLIVPVIYKQCTLPPTIQALSKLDYTRGDKFKCFWDRLAASIRETDSPALHSNFSSMTSIIASDMTSSSSAIRIGDRSPVASGSSGYASASGYNDSGIVSPGSFSSKKSPLNRFQSSQSAFHVSLNTESHFSESKPTQSYKAQSCKNIPSSPEETLQPIIKKSNSTFKKMSSKPFIRNIMKKKHKEK